jgi:3,4-dihydroxy 2-butanone 4-phosphate synthase
LPTVGARTGLRKLTALTPLDEAVSHFAVGGFVALMDHPEREGEADLLCAVEHITGEKVNFMATHARGLVTCAIEARRLHALDIRLIEPRYHGDNVPAFTEPVDYIPTTTTGVSAYERAATMRALLDPTAGPQDFTRPGHVFPLAADPQGLAGRRGHTEGAITLALMAGLKPAVVMCEVMAPDGHMAHEPQIIEFCRSLKIPLVSVPQILEALGRQ